MLIGTGFGFMGGFASWALAILAVVVAGTVLDIFLSEKKLGKSVRAVFASLTVLIIISPLPSMVSGCEKFELESFSREVKLDQSFLNYANNQKKQALEQGLADALAEKGYKKIACNITAEFGTEINISQVVLSLSNLVISPPATNTNKEENIKNLTAEFLKISRDKIVLNE